MGPTFDFVFMISCMMKARLVLVQMAFIWVVVIEWARVIQLESYKQASPSRVTLV